jgi:hypothetical protein
LQTLLLPRADGWGEERLSADNDQTIIVYTTYDRTRKEYNLAVINYRGPDAVTNEFASESCIVIGYHISQSGITN